MILAISDGFPKEVLIGCDIARGWVTWTSSFLFSTVDYHIWKLYGEILNLLCTNWVLALTLTEIGFFWTSLDARSLWFPDECCLHSGFQIGSHPSQWNLSCLSYFPGLCYQRQKYKKMPGTRSLFIQFWLSLLILLHLTTIMIVFIDIMICTATGTAVLGTVLHIIKDKQVNVSLWAVSLLLLS